MSTTPPATPLIGFQHRAGFLLSRLGRMADRQWAQALRGAGLTQTRFQTMIALAQKPGSRQRDIAAGIGVDPRNLVPVVSRLVADGLVASAPDPDDGRTKRLSLSAPGSAVLAGLAGEVAAGRRVFFAGLSEQEYDELCRLLDRVYSDSAG